MKVCPLCLCKLHWNGKKLFCPGEKCGYVETVTRGQER